MKSELQQEQAQQKLLCLLTVLCAPYLCPGAFFHFSFAKSCAVVILPLRSKRPKRKRHSGDRVSRFKCSSLVMVACMPAAFSAFSAFASSAP